MVVIVVRRYDDRADGHTDDHRLGPVVTVVVVVVVPVVVVVLPVLPGVVGMLLPVLARLVAIALSLALVLLAITLAIGRRTLLLCRSVRSSRRTARLGRWPLCRGRLPGRWLRRSLRRRARRHAATSCGAAARHSASATCTTPAGSIGIWPTRHHQPDGARNCNENSQESRTPAHRCSPVGPAGTSAGDRGARYMICSAPAGGTNANAAASSFVGALQS